MKTPIDPTQLAEIESMFKRFADCGRVMRDGAISMDRYAASNPRIMWVLKQNIDYDYDSYSEQLTNNLHHVSSSPTWRRLAHASHGILSQSRDFDQVKDAEKDACVEALISTAMINVNKEPGGSDSPDDSILEGYGKFRDLVRMQIEALAPDVVIVCMTGIAERLKPIVESVYKDFTGDSEFTIGGNSKPATADVAWAKSGAKIFLWAYHPAYSRPSDKDYFDGLMNAYDDARKACNREAY
jgi:hypothetical protein